MPEDITPAPAPEPPAVPEPAAPAEKTYTEAELNAAAAAARKAHADELKALREKAARLDELEAASLSEKEKAEKAAKEAEERAAKLEAELATERITALKTRIAAEKGLDPKLAARLTGTTEEEITADAETFAALIPKSNTDFGQGGGGSSTDLSVEQASKMSLDDYEKAVADGRI